MTGSLPPRPSLESLKKQAKTLQKRWRAGSAETLTRIRAAHPQYTGMSDDQLRVFKPRLTIASSCWRARPGSRVGRN